MSAMFPNEDDLSGAAFSLAQLQAAYRLNVSQLASGTVQLSNGISFASVTRLNGIYIFIFIYIHFFVIRHCYTHLPSSYSRNKYIFEIARDCLFIGKHAFNKGLYDTAVEWLSAAAQVAPLENNPTASTDDIRPFLSTAIRVVGPLVFLKILFSADFWRWFLGGRAARRCLAEERTVRRELANELGAIR